MNPRIAKTISGSVAYGLVPALLVQAARKPRLREGFAERSGFGFWKSPKADRLKHCVWFHAASVGEVKGLVPVVSQFRLHSPEIPILITITSETGREAVEKAGIGDAVAYFPLDLPHLWNSILTQLEPRLFVICETELWPNALFALRKHVVPVVVINGRISDRAFERYLKFKNFFSSVLHGVSFFAVQSRIDAERFAHLGASSDRITVLGSTKYDFEVEAVSETEKSTRVASFGRDMQRPCLVAGSVRPEEDAQVLSAYVEIRRKFPNLQLIIAPRHPERFEAVWSLIQEQAKSVGARCVRKTQLESTLQSPAASEKSPDIILLDTLGDLTKAYSLATVSFVGGSLVNLGGHNPFEPAQYGSPVIVGPHTQNFRDAVSQLKELGGVIQVEDSVQLVTAVLSLLGDQDLLRRTGEAARDVWKRNVGATQAVIDVLEHQLQNPDARLSELDIVAQSSENASDAIKNSALSALSLLYRSGVGVRNSLYEKDVFSQYRSTLPVISVGNVAVGGSGKSPFVGYLVRQLEQMGYKPVILLRGYGGKLKGPRIVEVSDAAQAVGDEALMHCQAHRDVPVVVSKSRTEGAKLIESLQLGDVIVLDDGLQHRALDRDADILLVDVSEDSAVQDLVHDRILPLGRLRESIYSGARRATNIGIVQRVVSEELWNQTQQSARIVEEFLSTICGNVPRFNLAIEPVCFRDILSGETIQLDAAQGVSGDAVTAIARPELFFAFLEQLGLKISRKLSYPDHYQLDRDSAVKELFSESNPQKIFTTAKDAVKLHSLVHKPGQVFVLELRAVFMSGEGAFWKDIFDRTKLDPRRRSSQFAEVPPLASTGT